MASNKMARAMNRQKPDQLILKNRKKEEKLHEMRQLTLKQRYADSKNEWERQSDNRAMIDSISKEVNSRLMDFHFNLETRRERLRSMLIAEDHEYIAQMEESEESIIERQAKMKERAKYLRDQRERDRLQYVQEKYDQQYRAQCEELRSTLSKREQDMVCIERMEQLKLKEKLISQKKAEDEMYADLWEKDRLQKVSREEREARLAHDRNRETVDVLQRQTSALEAHKLEAERIKQEEQQLMREQVSLRKMEDIAAASERREKRKEIRNTLDQSVKMKSHKKAKEEQEQIAFDLKIMEQLLLESCNEAKENLQRKKELRDEDQSYRRYLARILEDERRSEQELEKFIQQETEAAWQKRMCQWRTERQVRRNLLQEVITSRDKQVQERLLENDRRAEENERERQELLRSIEENRLWEKERDEKRACRSAEHVGDLQQQIQYNKQLADQEKRNEEYEYLMGQQAEREYKEKLTHTLSNPVLERVHPMRRSAQQ